MAQIIIGIHGLGNKPPASILEKWWKMAIREGLRAIGQPRFFYRFKLVYWADLLYPQPMDPKERNPKAPLYLEDPYQRAKYFRRGSTANWKHRIYDYLEDQLEKLLVSEKFFLKLNVIGDLIIRHFFRDLAVYYGETELESSEKPAQVRKLIRDRLKQVLYQYRDYDILLIAHSMGSIIAYDVLTELASEIEIDTLVTIGSPLGLPIIMRRIKAEAAARQQPADNLPIPDNILSNWYNFSDLDDKVTLTHALAESYTANSKGLAITDQIIHNNFIIDNQRNPHKVYGYLRAPEFALSIHHFLDQGRSGAGRWFSGWRDRMIQKLFPIPIQD